LLSADEIFMGDPRRSATYAFDHYSRPWTLCSILHLTASNTLANSQWSTYTTEHLAFAQRCGRLANAILL
jgi:hypothetical protein